MVKSFLIINYIIAYSFSVYGQTNNNSDDCYIIVIDEPSIYPGGIDSMKSFVARNLKYPHTALRDKIEGTVYVEFWIDTSGLTVDHKIMRGVRPDLDDEAIRVSKLIVFSQPAKQRGKPIKSRLTIPFKFELPETSIKRKRRFCKEETGI
jgi:protein TonB